MEITKLIAVWDKGKAKANDKDIVRRTLSDAEDRWNAQNDKSPNIVEKRLSAEELLAAAPRQNVDGQIEPHPAVVKFISAVKWE